MEITNDNYNTLDLEQSLECLPPRYIHHPFDQIFELEIKKSSVKYQDWSVIYKHVQKNGEVSFRQRTNSHLILAVREIILDLLKLGIKLSISKT